MGILIQKELSSTLIALLLLGMFSLAPSYTYSQVAGATLTGTITDSSGAVIPGVQVRITNEATAETRSVSVNSAGLYSAPNLLPGKYDVSVSAAGFATTEQKGVVLTVGAQQVLNLKMQVGKINETIEVKDEAPPVQLNDSTVSGVVNETTVEQLPLNGRDWTSLATLQPGVDSLGSVQANTGGPDRARRGYGVQMTISGTRPTQNSYRIDGINVNDYTNGGPGSVEGSTLGVDAVQEFSVLTSNYSAEYGRTAGGVVNALTKSGTNAFHGDVYEFLRNSSFDAKNFFDQSGPIPLFHRNQFGAAFGGPIFKDKTFFFADYEGLRENNGITTLATVPSMAARKGILCSQPGTPPACQTTKVSGAANPDPATGIDKAVLPFLGLWGPENPNLPYFNNGDIGTYAFVGGHVTTENFAVGRLDHRFSDKDSFFGSYQYDLATLTQPDPNNDVLVGNTTGRGYAALEETHIVNSEIVNSARFGFNRSLHTAIGMSAINPLAADLSLGENPGADNPQIDIPGITSAQPGLNQIERLDFFENSYQAYDDLFWTHGIHGLKMGFAFERVQLNAFDPAPAGEIMFGSLASPGPSSQNPSPGYGFLTNDPINLSAPLPSAPFIHFNFRSSIFGGYFQDDIRLRPTLTINLGLRYEMSTVPTEAHGHLSALESPFGQTFQDTLIAGSVFHNPTYHNFEPRVGFAWDPFGNGRTSIRGGFGIFDVLPLPYLLGQFATNTAPFTENGTAVNLPAGSFPTQAFNILASAAQNNLGLRVAYIQPNPKRDYLMQWNVSVQHELVSDLTAMLAYVGSRGIHQIFRADDINTVMPINGSNPPYLWPAPGTGTPISPDIGRMDTLQWNNDSYFDGMELQIQKRMSHGVEVGGGYTWSRAIDGGDGSIASDSFLNSIPALLYFLPRYRRTAADFNITHNLTINYLWNVPVGSLAGPLAWVAKGWQVGGITQIRSGMPFTALIGGDPLGLTDSAPFAYPDRLTGPGCAAPVNPQNAGTYIKTQCFALPVATPAIASLCVPFAPNGVVAPGTCSNLLGNGSKNDLYGPGLIDFDFSAVKDTHITERVNVEFRAEMFNIFNRPNFNPPLVNNAIFNSDGSANGTAGFLDSTSTTSRQIQFALKVMF